MSLRYDAGTEGGWNVHPTGGQGGPTLPQIRPYELVQSARSQAPSAQPRPSDAATFERFLGTELSVSDLQDRDDHDSRTDGVDLDYLAAELACRRNLMQPASLDAAGYPIQTAYFLRQQNRSEDSPMRKMRLGGVMKAATVQLRNGVPATGAF